MCAVEISSDNKSPVPKCCFECYEQQSAVEDALTAEQMDPQADDAKFAETKTPPPAFEKDTPASEKELLTEVACPELGWAKRKRESEMSWYARIQAFRHGSEKKKQKFYHEQWSGFDQKHKERFRKEIEAKLFPEQPVFAPKQTNAKAAGSKQGLVAWRQVQDDGRSVVHLPSGYTICALTKDFQEYAANPVAHDQKRWEMYALIFLFMSSGDPPFRNPEAPRLKKFNR